MGEETVVEGGEIESAVESTPSVDASVAEDVQVASDSTSPSSVQETEETAETAYEEFDWGEWDGEVDGLPDTVKPWAQKVYDSRQGWVDTQINDSEAEMARLKSLYETLISGHDDPRLDEYQTSIADWEGKFTTLQTTHDETLAQHEQYKKAVDAAIEAEANDYAEKFQKKHADIFTQKEKATVFSNLVEEGWDFEIVPHLMKLSGEQLDAAREAKRGGCPDQYALQLVGRSKPSKPDPRPGAQITAGATSPSVTPNQIKNEAASAKSFDDIRTIAARSALKRHTGGRR